MWILFHPMKKKTYPKLFIRPSCFRNVFLLEILDPGQMRVFFRFRQHFKFVNYGLFMYITIHNMHNNGWQIIIIRWNISIFHWPKFRILKLNSMWWFALSWRISVKFDSISFFFMSVQWRKSCPVLFISSWSFLVNWSTKFIFSILLLWNFESEQSFFSRPNGIAIVHFDYLTNHSFQIFWLVQAILNDMLDHQPSAFSHFKNNTKQYLKFEMDFVTFAFCHCILYMFAL